MQSNENEVPANIKPRFIRRRNFGAHINYPRLFTFSMMWFALARLFSTPKKPVTTIQNLKKDVISIQGLSDKHGMDRRTVRKLVKGLSTVKAAEAAIKAWRSEKKGNGNGSVDPSTGLTWYQAELRENVLRARADREREQRMAGGELVPVGVLEEAAKMITGSFARLAGDLTAGGVALDDRGRRVVTQLGARAASDFALYVRQWLDRQVEIQKQNHQ